jgi:alkylation response protein AidB-like acyl-CoA dehydrogenase
MVEEYSEIREAVRGLCRRFDGAYWRRIDKEQAYPTEFVAALTEAGYLARLIPEAYGGSGLGLGEAAAVLEEIHCSGGNGAACHAQMYTMASLLKHGSEEQKSTWLPQIARGSLRLQAFAITEPGSGTDTSRIETTAIRSGEHYAISGQKVFISRVEHSDLMLLLARTAAREEGAKRADGLSLLLVDLREARGKGLTVRPLATLMNHHTTELFFDRLEVPIGHRIGDEGSGFRYVLDSMNAERILIAAECIGDARYFVDRAANYASLRTVFGRPIGSNQGVQFPISRAYADLRAAALMVRQAASLFDAGYPCGAEANMAKLLAADASSKAADVCLQTHGGYGFAVDFDIERKFRETRLYQAAPVSTNLILSYIGTRVLGMPKSF